MKKTEYHSLFLMLLLIGILWGVIYWYFCVHQMLICNLREIMCKE